MAHGIDTRDLPSMLRQTFEQGVADFTKLVEKSEQAQIKLNQEKSHFTVWLLGISTGAFIFVMVNTNKEIKAAFSSTIHLMLVIHAVQVVASVLLRIYINSYVTLTEQKLVLLSVQELYLQTKPQYENLKEHDLFGMYQMLTEFCFVRPIVKDIVDPLLSKIAHAARFVKFLHISITVLFLVNYFLFVCAAWQ